jgi:glycosyltransferase involved in cell wall biosynthesis
MRIAILTNAFPPDARGGAGRIAGIYADLLKRRGHVVRVWGPSTEFSQLGSTNVFRRLRFHLADLKAHEGTIEEIMEWKADVALTHNLTGCGFGTPAALKDAGLRWVHVLHDVQLVEPSGQIVAGESFPMSRALWRKYWSALRHDALGEPDAVVSPTKWLLEFHQRFGWFRGCEVRIIPNPVEAIHEPLPQDGIRPTQVLFVGRLDADKGIDLLLEAWKSVCDVATKLVLIGDGSWSVRIRQLADSKIELRGQLPPEQVADAMRQSAVVVVPSRVYENQPTVILEAAAADCRIVAADVGGVRETLGEAGIVVPPNDTSALAGAIRRQLVEPHSDNERRARRELSFRHDPDVSADALCGLLRSNLNTSSE